MKVSVIMPVRNAGRFLVEAVDSILGQTHRDLELLVVDDHSSDGAVEALRVDDPRLRTLVSPDEGVVAAFNAGLAAAESEFIARMDADDIAMPERFERQLGLLSDRPDISIAGTQVEIFSRRRVRSGNRRYQSWLNDLTEPEDIHREMFVESPIPNPTALFRRPAIEALGGYRDVEGPEDYDLYLRADRAGMNMAKPRSILLRWRDHGGRLTRTDSRYARSAFQRTKARFLAAGPLRGRVVLIWGAGPTGREFHDLLVAEGVRVAGFVDVHPRRIGGEKRERPVWPIERAASDEWDRIVVAVGAAGARQKIRDFMQRAGKQEGDDYLFVA